MGTIKQFIDEKDFIHTLDKKLAAGGQGVVYTTKNKNILLKMGPKDKKSNKFYDRVDKIKSLNINKNLKFAIPLLKLKLESNNYEGYIMEMLEDMKPIGKDMKTSFSTFNDIHNYYIETGGLKKRLEILKKIAYNLYALHSKGIVYGDISANNIFISEDKNIDEVWFIDCDNIDYSDDIDYVIGSKSYAAPEILRKLPPYNEKSKTVNTIENDIYAFANLAFMYLFLASPFRGSILDKIKEEEFSDSWDDDDWDDWDDESSENIDEIEKMFDLGEVSWVGEKDANNRPVAGFTTMMDKMITPGLYNLFDRTLGKEGRENPSKRPSLRLWYEEFVKNLSVLDESSFEDIKNFKKNDIPFFYFDEESFNTVIIRVIYPNNKKDRLIIQKNLEEFKLMLTYENLGIGSFGKKDEKVLILSKEHRNDIKYYLKNETNKNLEVKGKDESFKLTSRKKEVFDFENLEITLEGLKLKIGVNKI